MNGSLLYQLWGKTNEKSESSEWTYHPAICHMIDVGYVAEEWLRLCPWILERFGQLAPGIERDVLRRIIVCIVALHDLGKVHRSFQSKSEEGWKVGYGAAGHEQKPDKGHGFDHGVATARILSGFAMTDMPQWRPYLDAIHAVAAHHGRLYMRSEVYARAELSNYDKRMAYEMIEAITTLFCMPQEAIDNDDALRNAPFLMLLAGFASVADWFGSQSEVFHFHPLSSFDEACGYLEMLRRSGRAEQQLGDAGLLATFEARRHDFASLFAFNSLHPLQKRSEAIPFGSAPGPEMIIVEGAMGMGKTEIALYLTAKAIASGSAAGLYFALPTQASSNALFGRIKRFAGHIGAPGSEISLGLAHGGRRFFEPYHHVLESFQRSRERVKPAGDEPAIPSEIIATAWLQSSKRMLLAAVGIGTIDQAMLGAVAVKHAFVRLFALAGKVVVFDEIHAYDAYMNELIVHLLRWLNVLGVKVVLLSATLPRTLRIKLLGTYGAAPGAETTSSEQDPYPQILYVHHQHLDDPYSLDDEGSVSGNEDDACGLDGDDEQEGVPEKEPVAIVPLQMQEEERTMKGAELVMSLVEGGGCVAWIRNTVREAQQAWCAVASLIAERSEATDEPIGLVLLHARFTRRDRDRVEQYLVRILGRDGGSERPKRMVVIATQVIEQSVDIDFDAMVSDLAPVDLLLQRLGRLWRHERSRELRYRHAAPVLHVLIPVAAERYEMRFGSSAYVYDAETLARSVSIVFQSTDSDTPVLWKMPDACRALVARLYDQGEEHWTAERMKVDPEQLASARKAFRGVQALQTGSAQKILMPRPDAGVLTMEASLRDDDRDGNVALTTRYGGASVTVILVRIANGALQFVGQPDLRLQALPLPHETRRILDIERAVALSSVSFPWRKELQRGALDGSAAAFDTWWRQRHPYDNKIVLVLDEDGGFVHPQFNGCYRFDDVAGTGEGLVVQPASKQMPTSTTTSIPFEEF